MQIGRFLGINKINNEIKMRETEIPKKEISLLEQGGGFDTVSFSIKKSEKFQDVRDELAKNVPDRTTTVEEKEKAISYIERMLKCDDITPEMKNYWSNKKDIIKMEIQSIKNEEQAGNDTDYQELEDEYYNFIQQHWCDNYPTERNENLDFLYSEEYGITFYNTCISYLNRMLAFENLPEDKKEYFEQLINHWNGEKQSRLGEINWYKQNNEMKTESFNDVFEEFSKNVPDSTTTLEEKKLAAGYIKRMLTCDDIPADLKNYWSNKEDILRMEMQNILNNQQIGNDESINDVANEWREFTDRYWNKTQEFDNTADRAEYYRSYFNMYISFCDRILTCKDIPDDVRQEWINMKMGAISDLNYHNRDLNEYNKENGIKTESFKDVYEEFDRNVPDRTTTADEKYLALSYIERMLSCDDIPNNLKIYWQNKEAAIKNELEQF